MDNKKKQVYFVIGSKKSGRREILYDLIEGSSHQNLSTVILVGNRENDCPNWDEKLKKLAQVRISKWNAINGELFFENVDDADRIFYLAHSDGDLAIEVELFRNWLNTHEYDLTRVLGIVDCDLAEKAGDAGWEYYEALAHFSDYLLLTNYKNLEKKWLSTFINQFKEKSFPCIIEKIKNGRVENPMIVLDNMGRRITQIFDEFDPLDEMQFDEDNLPDEPFEIKHTEDPYLARSEEGERIKPIVNINLYHKNNDD